MKESGERSRERSATLLIRRGYSSPRPFLEPRTAVRAPLSTAMAERRSELRGEKNAGPRTFLRLLFALLSPRGEAMLRAAHGRLRGLPRSQIRTRASFVIADPMRRALSNISEI